MENKKTLNNDKATIPNPDMDKFGNETSQSDLLKDKDNNPKHTFDSKLASSESPNSMAGQPSSSSSSSSSSPAAAKSESNSFLERTMTHEEKDDKKDMDVGTEIEKIQSDILKALRRLEDR